MINGCINSSGVCRLMALADEIEKIDMGISSKMATLKQQYEAAFQTSVSEMILGNKSVDEYDSIVSQAKKDMYDEILKIYNDAYQRYLKKLEANK